MKIISTFLLFHKAFDHYSSYSKVLLDRDFNTDQSEYYFDSHVSTWSNESSFDIDIDGVFVQRRSMQLVYLKQTFLENMFYERHLNVNYECIHLKQSPLILLL